MYFENLFENCILGHIYEEIRKKTKWFKNCKPKCHCTYEIITNISDKLGHVCHDVKCLLTKLFLC